MVLRIEFKEELIGIEEYAIRWCDKVGLGERTRVCFADALRYNVSGGKNIRKDIFMNTLEQLCPGSSGKHEVLGWCIEVLQASFLISDDISDCSRMRRGDSCWYLKIGKKAARDSLFLYSFIFYVIKEIYSGEKFYSDLISLFSRVSFKTTLGQAQDTLRKEVSCFEDAKRLYSMERYRQIVRGKTAYYTFYLPLKLAYICTERREPPNLEDFSIKMGMYLQFQDDRLNFYPRVSGKSETDLRTKKLTWYIATLVENSKSAEDQKVVVDYLRDSKYDGLLPMLNELLKSYEKDEDGMVEDVNAMIGDDNRGVYEYCIKRLYRRRN
jgi:farnesyl diphosphate synthase